MTGEVPKKRRLRKVLLGLAALLVLLLVVLAAVFFYGQSGSGKAQIASLISRLLSDRLHREIRIEGVSGFIPFAMHVDKISLGDDEGIWLIANNTNIGLTSSAFLRRRVHIHTLNMEGLQILRRPAPKEDRDPLAWQVPAIPKLPAWITVAGAKVGALRLEEPVLGQAATLALEGSYLPETGTGGWKIELEALRTDLEGTTAALHLAQEEDALDLQLTLDDATLLPALLKVPPPVVLSAEAGGPLEDWQASFASSVSGEILAAGTVALKGRAPTVVDAKAKLQLTHPLLPPVALQAAGEFAELDLSGALTAEGVLTLARAVVTAPKLALKTEGQVGLNDSTLALDVTGEHRDIRPWLSREDLDTEVPATLMAKLEGGFRDFALEFNLSSQEKPVLQLDANLNFTEGAAIAGDYRAWPPADALSPDMLPLAGEGFTGTIDVAAQPDQRILIRRFTATADWIDLQVQGELDQHEKRADLKAEAALKDLGRPAALFGQPLRGTSNLTAHLLGGPENTSIGVTLQSPQLSFKEYRATGLEATADILGGAWPTGIREGLRVSAKGNASVESPQLETARALHFAVEGGEDGEVLLLDRIAVEDGNLVLNASGAISREGPTVDLDAELRVDRVEEYAALLDKPYTGAVALTGNVRTSADRVITGHVEGAWNQPGGLPEAAQAMLGEALKLETEFSYAAPVLTLAKAQVNAAALSASATGTIHLDAKTMDLDARASVADAGALRPGETTGVSGALEVTAAVAGAFDAFGAKGQLTASNFAVPGLRADEASVKFALAGLPKAPQGSIDGTASVEGERLALTAEVSTALPEIQVKKFKLASRENTITGAVTANVETKAATGDLRAELRNLAALGNFVDQELGGSATATARFTSAQRGTTLDLNATGTALRTPWLEADKVAVKGQVTGIPKNTAGNLTISGTDLTKGATQLRSLQATVAGNLETAQVSAKLQGMLRQETAFALETQVQASVKDRRGTVQQLSGNIEGENFALEGPATLSMTEGAASLSPAKLRIADGLISVEGALGRETVNATAAWSDLPLSVAALLGAPALEGRAGGSVRITGPAAAPVAQVEARLTGLRHPAAPAEVPPADIEASATISNGTLLARATLGVPDAAGIEAEARFPIVFSVSPFNASLPDAALLAGTLKGKADIGAIPALMGVEAHVLSGDFTADLTLGGLVRSPQVSGGATLSGGRYENVKTGTILNDITAALEANRQELRLTSFSATDNETGRLTGKGQLALDKSRQFPFVLEVELGQARLVRRDDLTGVVNGQVQATGTFSDTLVTGALTISPLHLRLPERLPARKLRTVEVREVGQKPTSEVMAAAESQGDLEVDYIFPDPETEPPDQNAPGQNLRFDIQADFPGQAYVTGHGVDSEWRGSLHIGGTKADPRLAGTLNVVRGDLTFLGRRSNLEEGALTFTRDSPPSPYVNVVAVADTNDIEARLRLSGNFNALELDMQSTPPLPQDEILARVLFGKDLSAVGPGQALQLARYAAVFSGKQGGMELLSGPQELPGLDKIDIIQGGSLAETSLGFGENLNDRVYVELEQGIGPESGRARIEIELTDDLSLEGKASGNNRNSIGLYWKRDY